MNDGMDATNYRAGMRAPLPVIPPLLGSKKYTMLKHTDIETATNAITTAQRFIRSTKDADAQEMYP